MIRATGTRKPARLTRVQAFLRRGGFGMAPVLRGLGPPPWRNAAFLLGFFMVAIEFGLFFGWHLSRPPDFSGTWFGFLGSNQWRNQIIDQFALSLRETFGLWPRLVPPDLPWVKDCLASGAAKLAPEIQHNCAFLLRQLAASENRGAEWWRLVSYMFLHGGLLHLALNMLAYAVFAPTILRRCGNLRFVGFFVLCGVVAGLAHFALRIGYEELLLRIGVRDTPSGTVFVPLVGASGAIFGLWLACLRIQYDRLRRIAPGRRPIEPREYLKRIFINVLAINILFMLTQSLISGEAHLGGALAGFLLAPMFFSGPAALRARAKGFVRINRWGLRVK